MYAPHDAQTVSIEEQEIPEWQTSQETTEGDAQQTDLNARGPDNRMNTTAHNNVKRPGAQYEETLKDSQKSVPPPPLSHIPTLSTPTHSTPVHITLDYFSSTFPTPSSSPPPPPKERCTATSRQQKLESDQTARPRNRPTKHMHYALGVCHTTQVCSIRNGGGEFDWDSSTRGLLLSGVSMLTFVMPFFTDHLSRRVGAKALLFWTMLMAGGVTMLQPLGTRVSPYLLLAMRMLIGFIGKRSSPPYRQILTSVPTWGYLIIIVVHNYSIFVLVAFVPIYFNTAMGFSVEKVGLISSVIFAVRLVGVLVWGQISNLLLRKTRLTTTACRKVVQCTVPLDMAPRYAGFLTGFAVTVSSIFCMPGPLLTSYMVANGTMEEWRNMFLTLAVITTFGSTCFLFMASSELQAFSFSSFEFTLTVQPHNFSQANLKMNGNNLAVPTLRVDNDEAAFITNDMIPMTIISHHVASSKVNNDIATTK
ncbi:hypothetical protein ACOMHN_044745 [Nucella lapillus]